MKKLFTLIVVILLTLTVFAQAPQKMSYQCVVRNASGVLMTNQSVGIRISILQGTPSGTVVYQENYSPNPQTNANGLLTIEIGSGFAITGTFSAIDWSSGPYFLKTETDPSGGTSYTVVGTSQLLSVPYALYAKTAANGFSGNYDDLTNKPSLFNGTWASLTGKPTTLAGYGITNAMSTAHPANDITAADITHWSTAYGWGNHASAGYATFPSQAGNNGKFLKTNGSNPTWSAITSTSSGVQNMFQFVTYKPGSSHPIAFGFIASNGSIMSGSGNFTCTWNSTSGRYEIAINGESYFYSEYSTIITMIEGSSIICPGTSSVSGKLLVIFNKHTF